ncbi:hypothetical protein EJ06DRAFT_529815 [Trichodelitschia bisporula]|uniref:Uncharacterized protein n=1 Tax=Trichodelitschia bisporula TaxID=703511 RepID=A0A6G1HXB8_9PEZI|nr:hypothetical protein EJ06DRAFT_529815 [Trichodelitschia bisporula]
MLVKQLRFRALVFGVFSFCAVTYLLLPSSPYQLQEEIYYYIPGLRAHDAPRHPRYKSAQRIPPPIVDNFPLAAAAKTPSDLPPVPSYNRPPAQHAPEKTPLFIGFTRNWPLLQQAVVSYITAGWPPSDIYVVENTGTMNANARGQLTLQNPFYLDHRRLTDIFGINVISTPTYLSFSQLQNFYIHESIQRNWTHYYWSHMDAAAVSKEDWSDPHTKTYRPLYARVVEDLRDTLTWPASHRWAVKLYAYDRLALVNRAAYEAVGGWDTQIPYYGTDCDMHERLLMAGYTLDNAQVGLVYDVGAALDDLLVLYRRKPVGNEAPIKAVAKPTGEARGSGNGTLHVQPAPAKKTVQTWGEEDALASQAFHLLAKRLDVLQREKNSNARGRNTWQAQQFGGKGEPYYRDPEGFETALQMTIKFGREVMAEKWGRKGCSLRSGGLQIEDQWRVRHDSDWN